MIFDAHSDLFTAVLERYKKGENQGIDKYIDQLKFSQTVGGIFVVFLEPEKQFYENFAEMFNLAKDQINISPFYDIVYEANDLYKKTNTVKVIMGAESLAPLQFSVTLLEEFYKKGLRHAMLTWNEENELGTGAKGDKYTGLKEKGYQFLDKMIDLKMIIDLSHANERTFDDIIEYIDRPVICSHSNCFKLCNHVRNLKDHQILKIKAKNGVIGVTAVGSFISNDQNRHTIEGLLDHIDYIVELAGIDYVGLGFDYMGFYNENNGNLRDLFNFSHSSKLIDALIFRGYSKEDIDKITHKNFMRVIDEIFNWED